MLYRVVFREITQEDLDRNCPFVPEAHVFEMYLEAVVHDASCLDGVTEVYRDGSHAIVLTTDAALDVIKERFTPILQDHWAHLRMSSFDLPDGSKAECLRLDRAQPRSERFVGQARAS